MDSLLAKFPKAKIDKCTKVKEGVDIAWKSPILLVSRVPGRDEVREGARMATQT